MSTACDKNIEQVRVVLRHTKAWVGEDDILSNVRQNQVINPFLFQNIFFDFFFCVDHFYAN